MCTRVLPGTPSERSLPPPDYRLHTQVCLRTRLHTQKHGLRGQHAGQTRHLTFSSSYNEKYLTQQRTTSQNSYFHIEKLPSTSRRVIRVLCGLQSGQKGHANVPTLEADRFLYPTISAYHLLVGKGELGLPRMRRS